MELMDAIRTRRSVRSYRPDAVSRETIESLLQAAVLAPTGMNLQPWAFGVIQDADKIHGYSERVKALLLSKVDELPWLARFEQYFRDPGYSVFYNAPALIVIYGTDAGPTPQTDCALAAENLMLAACAMGLGSCWIGFARDLMDSPEVKRELGVPETCTAVAPIIVGSPAGDASPRERKPPEILYWK